MNDDLPVIDESRWNELTNDVPVIDESEWSQMVSQESSVLSRLWGATADAVHDVGSALVRGVAAPIGLGLDTLNAINPLAPPQENGEMFPFTSAMLGAIDEVMPMRVQGTMANIARAPVEALPTMLATGTPPLGLATGSASAMTGSAAQQAFPESPYAGLLASVLTDVGAQGAISATRTFNPKVQAGRVLLHNAGAEGSERIRNIASNIDSLEGPAGPITYAEIAQTPSAAAYQRTIEKTPGIGDSVTQRGIARQSARKEILQELAPTSLDDAGLTMSDRGSIVQGPMANRAKAEVRAANEMYRDIGDPTGIDVEGVRKGVASTKEQMFGSRPLSMDEQANRVINFLDQDSMVDTGLLDSKGRPIIESEPRTMGLQELDKTRTDAGRVVGRLSRTDKGAPEIAVMKQVRDGLDEAVDQAIESGTLDPETAKALQAARAARAKAGETFQNKSIRPLVKQGEYGRGFAMPQERVIVEATKNPTVTARVMTAFGDMPEVVGQLKAGWVDQMPRDFSLWPRWFNQRRAVADTLFGADVPRMQAVMDDITGEATALGLADRASRKQSATGQYLTAAGRFLTHGPANIFRLASGQAGTLGGSAGAGTLLAIGKPVQAGLLAAGTLGARALNSSIERWIARGLTDPDTLRLLASSADANNLAIVTSRFLTDLAAGTIATTDDLTVGDVPQELIQGENSDQPQDNIQYHSSSLTPSAGPNQGDSDMSRTAAFVVPATIMAMSATNQPVPLPVQGGPSQPVIESLFGEGEMGRNPSIYDRIQEAESGRLGARAVSPVGAMGLMQIMPGTWREIMREMGLPENSDPFDPDLNRKAGEHYYNKMLNKYGGEVELALAAYNWGPGNLDNLIDRVGSRSMALLRPRLPRETRNYLAKILNSNTANA